MTYDEYKKAERQAADIFNIKEEKVTHEMVWDVLMKSAEPGARRRVWLRDWYRRKAQEDGTATDALPDGADGGGHQCREEGAAGEAAGTPSGEPLDMAAYQ
jgi:hypothetical protein